MSVDNLGRHLYWLSTDGDLLDDLLVPRQPTSGENAGRPPQRGKSKPPVVLGIVDLKAYTEGVLAYWCGQLVASDPSVGSAPPCRRISPRAEWLRARVPVIQEMPWAEMMADEIAGQAMVVRDVVSPPARASDPDPIEEGTAREVAAWLRHLGFTTHRRTIQRWIDEGKLEARKVEDGRVIVRLEEARDLAKRR